MNDIINYDWVIVGSGSASNLYNSLLNSHHGEQVTMAVIDKDEPGGICLTRGCIPSKILVYPAELIRTIEHAEKLGIHASYDVDFNFIMNRMRHEIGEDIDNIRQGLTESDEIDYYHQEAEFIDDYTLNVGESTIKGENIILCLGSKPYVPNIENTDNVEFMTSKEFLKMETQPDRMVIVGGGYIAAEYGHFMSAMGTEITILGRNSQFLPDEEPEVGQLAKKKMNQWMDIHTSHEVTRFEQHDDEKIVYAMDLEQNEEKSFPCDAILVAAGRVSNTDLIKPAKSGVETDDHGWIKTDNRMRTSKDRIWAFGDANGSYLYKHVGNKESIVALYNIFGHDQEMSYHAIPSAIFTYPEVAKVGLRQDQAEDKYGRDNIVIGFQKYENTAKGTAMGVTDYFVKVILEKETEKILGASIIGPHASDLIQEIIDLMYTEDRTPKPIQDGMHIHPALSEVVERAFGGYLEPEHYEHQLKEMGYQ